MQGRDRARGEVKIRISLQSTICSDTNKAKMIRLSVYLIVVPGPWVIEVAPLVKVVQVSSSRQS